jgi:hypothetical protein
MFNAGSEQKLFTIPSPLRTIAWRKFIDTAAESPDDIYPLLDGPLPTADARVRLEGRSLTVDNAHDKTIVL